MATAERQEERRWTVCPKCAGNNITWMGVCRKCWFCQACEKWHEN